MVYQINLNSFWKNALEPLAMPPYILPLFQNMSKESDQSIFILKYSILCKIKYKISERELLSTSKNCWENGAYL